MALQLNMSVEEVENLRRKRVATVVPRAFGLRVVDRTDPLYKIDPSRARSVIAHLLTANTPLPADTGPQDFRTVKDNQRTVQLEVWEQAGAVASEKPEHNTHIGEGTAGGAAPRPAGTPFQVVFHMTETGLLRCTPGGKSGREVRFESRSAAWMRRGTAGHIRGGTIRGERIGDLGPRPVSGRGPRIGQEGGQRPAGRPLRRYGLPATPTTARIRPTDRPGGRLLEGAKGRADVRQAGGCAAHGAR